MFLVPLINIERLKMKLMRMLLPKSYLVSSKGYDQLPVNQCAICHDSTSSENPGPIGQVQNFTVHTPYETNCGHQYCYYCIQSKLSVFGDEWPCLRCGEKVSEIHKHIEIVEDKPAIEESYIELEEEEENEKKE
jgi:peroxin-2